MVNGVRRGWTVAGPARPALRLAPRALAPVGAALLVVALGIRAALTPPAYTRLAEFPRDEAARDLVRGLRMDSAVAELVEAGASDLDAGRHAVAAERFRAALDQDPLLVEAAYLLGLAEALGGRPREAIPPLEMAVRLAHGDLREKARWVLANACLKARRVGDTRLLLEGLVRDDGEWSHEARELLAKLPQ